MKKAIKKVAQKATKTAQPSYTATVKVVGKTFEATGATLSEAVGNLPVGNVRGRAILTIEVGDVKREKVLMPMVVNRLFSASRYMKEVALKNISLLFGI